MDLANPGKFKENGKSAKSNEDGRWFLINHLAGEQRIRTIFGICRKNGLEPVLIKGWAAAANYPNLWDRYSSDIDIAVAPADYRKAQTVLQDHTDLSIDLHEGLRHLDTVEWEDLYDNSRLVEMGDAKIRVLRPEDHLRVMAVHWLQDGGAYRHRLYDIFYAVQNRRSDFDWARALDMVSEKRKKWIICTIGLAHRYLNLEIEHLPFREEALNLPNWLIEAVEEEWNDPVRLVSLTYTLGDRREFLRQFRKRVRPNALQATIDVNGNFGSFPRIFHRLGSILLRIPPSLRRFYKLSAQKKNEIRRSKNK